MTEEWMKISIYLVKNENGEKVAFPTPRQMEVLRERVRQYESDLEVAKSKKLNTTGLVELIADTNRKIASIEEIRKNLDKLGERFDYEIKEPDYGEYLDAEEQSKDWVSGEPRTNRSQMTLRLLAGHVKVQGTILDLAGVRSMKPAIAQTLCEELMGITFPAQDRLPFMLLSSNSSGAGSLSK